MCCKVLATLRFPWLITLPSVKFNTFKITTNLHNCFSQYFANFEESKMSIPLMPDISELPRRNLGYFKFTCTRFDENKGIIYTLFVMATVGNTQCSWHYGFLKKHNGGELFKYTQKKSTALKMTKELLQFETANC